MNKKVSTIFAMAALMGGAFCGSAYAQLSTTPVANGEIAGKTVMLFEGSNVVGVLKDADGNSVSDIKTLGTIEKGKELNYTWKVTKVATNSIQPYNNMYVFANAVTGDTLAFDPAVPVDLFFPQKNGAGKMEYAIDKHYAFAFGQNAASFPTYSNPAQLYDAAQVIDGVTPVNVLTLAGTPALSTTPGVSFNLQTLNLITVSDYELNNLYNGKGFNLDAKKESGITAEVGDNLFAGEAPIWAYTLNAPHSVGTQSDGNKLTIPAGTYFFTNPVFANSKAANDFLPTAPNRATENDINWLASTFIAVSPTVVGEETDANRGNGEGFKLVEVKGSDFIFLSNTSIPEGDDIYITNACFIVESNHAANDNYPYAIRLHQFYYQKSAQYAGTDDQTLLTDKAYLGVTSYNNIRQNVGTKNGTATHSFRLYSSSVVAGKSLLNETKTAAIYNIKFVDGPSYAKDLMNKYLTVGGNGHYTSAGYVSSTDFQWEAKGAAISETDYPIFQFVITAVDSDNNITFTNRETGESFTTQLFNEDGENRYSMSLSLNNVVPYTVNTAGANTYEVEARIPVTANADVIIELEKIENVDRYAGFLNVDDGEIRTLAFARDKNDTSNKFYAVVEENNELNAYNEFATDIADAAQWQLVRSESPVSISRVFVYNNTKTQSIDDVPNGDVVAAYVYALRYVEDGAATNYFLSNNNTNNPYNRELEVLSDAQIEDLSKTLKNSSDYNFIIKENVDGSVSLIKRSGAFSGTVSGNVYKYVAKNNVVKTVEAEGFTNNGKYYYDYDFASDEVYASASSADEVKTYLDPKVVEISWPAKEGHVTLLSELGNYINMNEDRDGIVVNESDGDAYYLYVTDKDAIVPSFYITKGIASENGERMFLFNPTDSVNYYVADGSYDRKYQWAKNRDKAIFKAASINETRDTLTMDVKGETKYVAKEADDNNADIWGGLNRFKFQIIEASDAEGYYYIRQPKATPNYLSNLNDKLAWSSKDEAMLFTIESVAAPTANEGVSATEVKIIATDGAVNVKNAAGKNVVISTILGQIVANEVLTSDNATISVPAGIAIVSVDGEEAVKVSVK